jgi:hypothetical protein
LTLTPLLLGAARASAASAPPKPIAPIPRSVWLYEPDPAALPSLNAWLDEILDHVKAANRSLLMDSEIRIHIIPQDWNLTDLPLWSTLRGVFLPDPNPYDSYREFRSYDDVRGLGASGCGSGPMNIAVAEEHVVALRGSRHPSPRAGDVGKVLVHEIGHGIECGLTDEQDDALTAAYGQAGRRPLSEVVGDMPSYSASTRHEYFAEGVVAWFEGSGGPSYRRDWLQSHDKALYDLMAQVFAVPEPVRLCNGERATIVKTSVGTLLGTPGDDVIVGSAQDDVINGGGGNDVICGAEGNDALFGGYGSDELYGGPGDDAYVGGSGDDVLSETAPAALGDGADVMDGGVGDDVLSGGVGADELMDSRGRDQLTGGPDNDRIDARDLSSDRQSDTIDGSEAYDTCQVDTDDTVKGCKPPPPPTTTTTTAPPRTTTTTGKPAVVAPTTVTTAKPAAVQVTTTTVAPKSTTTPVPTTAAPKPTTTAPTATAPTATTAAPKPPPTTAPKPTTTAAPTTVPPPTTAPKK